MFQLSSEMDFRSKFIRILCGVAKEVVAVLVEKKHMREEKNDDQLYGKAGIEWRFEDS